MTPQPTIPARVSELLNIVIILEMRNRETVALRFSVTKTWKPPWKVALAVPLLQPDPSRPGEALKVGGRMRPGFSFTSRLDMGEPLLCRQSFLWWNLPAQFVFGLVNLFLAVYFHAEVADLNSFGLAACAGAGDCIHAAR